MRITVIDRARPCRDPRRAGSRPVSGRRQATTRRRTITVSYLCSASTPSRGNRINDCPSRHTVDALQPCGHTGPGAAARRPSGKTGPATVRRRHPNLFWVVGPGSCPGARRVLPRDGPAIATTVAQNSSWMRWTRWRATTGTTAPDPRHPQHTSWLFGHRPRDAACWTPSARVACAQDHSLIESFFGSIQTELLDRRNWNTWAELASAIFEWLEAFFNPPWAAWSCRGGHRRGRRGGRRLPTLAATRRTAAVHPADASQAHDRHGSLRPPKGHCSRSSPQRPRNAGRRVVHLLDERPLCAGHPILSWAFTRRCRFHLRSHLVRTPRQVPPHRPSLVFLPTAGSAHALLPMLHETP